ncbi:unnamed protein product, partial [marine sediment metagenome]
QGAGGRAARPGSGGGWGSVRIILNLTESPNHTQGLGGGSRWGEPVLANAGANPQKSNYLW